MVAYNMALRLLRATSILAEALAASSIAVLHQPPSGGCQIKYYVTGGTNGTGTITVTGTVGGVQGQSEAITFTGNRWLLGNKIFTAISSIATSGLADESIKPTIKLEAVNSGGNPLVWDTEIGPYAISLRRKQQNAAQILRDVTEGRNSQSLYYVQSDEIDLDILPGERFTVDERPGDIFEVWSQPDDVPVVSGDAEIKTEFYARKVA